MDALTTNDPDACIEHITDDDDLQRQPLRRLPLGKSAKLLNEFVLMASHKDKAPVDRTAAAFERMRIFENAVASDAIFRKSLGIDSSKEKVSSSGNWQVVVDKESDIPKETGSSGPQIKPFPSSSSPKKMAVSSSVSDPFSSSVDIDASDLLTSDSPKKAHSYSIRKLGPPSQSVKTPVILEASIAESGNDAATLMAQVMQGTLGSQSGLTISPTKAVSLQTTSLRDIMAAKDRVPKANLSPRRQNIRSTVDTTSSFDSAPLAAAFKPPSFFPLEAFDDKSLEESQFLFTDATAENPVPAHSLWRFQDGTTQWKKCDIISYDSLSETWQIQWPDTLKLKTVTRLNLLLPTDSVTTFEERRELAIQHRAHVEAIFRFQHRVRNLPKDSAAPLPTDQFHRILKKIGLPISQELLHEKKSLVEEVLSDYRVASNEMVQESLDPESSRDLVAPHPVIMSAAARGQLLKSNKFHPHFDSFLRAEYANSIAQDNTPEWFAAFTSFERSAVACLVPLEATAIKAQAQTLASGSCWLNGVLVTAMKDIRVCLEKAGQASILWIPNATGTVAQFLAREQSELHEGITTLKESCIDQIGDTVLAAWSAEEKRFEDEAIALAAAAHLPEPQPGSVTLNSATRAKFKKLVHLTNEMVRSRFRDLVIDRIRSFCEVILSKCRSSSEFENEFALEDDLTLLQIAPFITPFKTQLVIENESVVMSPSIDVISSAALGVIDRFVVAVNSLAPLSLEMIDCPSKFTQLDVLPLDDPELVAFKNSLHAGINDSACASRALISRLNSFELLVKLNPTQFVAGFLKMDSGADRQSELLKAVETMIADKARLISSLPTVVNSLVLCMECNSLRDGIITRTDLAINSLLSQIAALAAEKCHSISANYKSLLAKINERPNDPEKLFELEAFNKQVAAEIDNLKASTASAASDIELLGRFDFDAPSETFTGYWEAFSWPAIIANAKEENAPRLEDERMKFMGELQGLQQEFARELESIDAEVKLFSTYGDVSRSEEISDKIVIGLQARLEDAVKRGALVNSRERLFEFAETSYEDIDRIIQDFDPYAQLWSNAGEIKALYPEWNYGPFLNLDPETVDKDVNRFWKLFYKLEKQFQGKDAPYGVCTQLKQQMEDFKQYLPLIAALRTPGLKDRHWETLSEQLGCELRPDNSMTLRLLIEMNVHTKEAEFSSIAEVAAKEYSFERALEKMKGEWDKLSFEIVPYKESGTFVLRDTSEISMLLDDQIVKVQAMRGSPFVKPLEKVVIAFNNHLMNMQEILEEWQKVQKTWLYLEPIFSSPDIMRQMPTEGRRFAGVDKLWRTIMTAAQSDPRVNAVMLIEKLKDNFVEANKALELVQKGLNDYLETKRAAFPRFFFLSNDELLDILSETKDPKRVVPHLPKCFEAICDVRFAGSEICSMVSGEKEIVNLTRNVQPDSDANRGNVEMWLIEMEQVMRDSLTDIGNQAAANYKEVARTQFVQDWAGQIVIAVDNLQWTIDIEEALRSGVKGAIAGVEQKLSKELSEIVQLVRGELSDIARLTLGALVVIDVHNRDVTTDLVNEGVSAVDEFAWDSQLRYYLEEGKFQVRQVSATCAYGYEYIGNSTRLVITPLTDRCYRTLMGAMYLTLGGAPQGPAGTGKTESVKDLSKAVSKQCVVFNCSDGLDYLAMAKFFKGLASCGAWSCFDEFNRIELEVLSVVAQQILAIQQAVKQKVKRFLFEGTEIPIDLSCATFITMNPGYAGRTELPDNLKALFRPCAMMIPNYAMIAEICLYSFGYTDARNLARKLVFSLRLSSEQLSSQDHYDFGMRAVKSIITAAGLLKRRFPDDPEDILCLRAINDVNLPKFVEADLPLFSGITSDLFLGIKVPEPDYNDLIGGLQTATAASNVELTPKLQDKCIQLYETITVRHGLMVVGLTMSMKSVCINSLASAMSSVPKFGNVQLFKLNPKSITMGQMYGMFDPVTREWCEGIAAKYVREASADPSPDRKWIIFDGPVDAIWIESMNTVLDDNKKLCLTSGEIIKLSNVMTMIFEPEDLAVASPATVSRCGMVFMEPQMLSWTSLILSWLNTFPPHAQAIKATIQKLCDHYFPPILRVVRRRCKEMVVTKDTELVASFIKLYDSHLDKILYEEEPSKRPSTGDESKLVDGCFLLSLIWSLGATSDDDGRVLFESTLKELMVAENAPKISTKMQDKLSVYDIVFDTQKLNWVNWMDTVPAYSIPDGSRFEDIMVPTVDTIRYNYVLEVLCTHGKHVLFVGATGTGKSLSISEKLMKGLPSNYIPIFMNFSAQTSANQTQDIIDAKLDKRRKGVFAPPLGSKMIFFVDDLNMPAKETYGAQPPIELLRQFMDHGGWYERKEIAFRNMIDVQVVSAMGPPGGGRSAITCRLSRHFNTVSLTPFSDASMSRIFTTLLDWFLKGISGTPANMGSLIVKGTLEVFKTVSNELLPTPSKSHYTFNLRDIAKVIQGMFSLQLDASADGIQKMWIHELQRIFQDRLINEEDRSWFDKLMDKVAFDLFKKNLDVICGDGADGNGLLLFADFTTKHPDPLKRPYLQVTDLAACIKSANEYLDEFNAMTTKPMSLVLFGYVVEHLCRVCRVLRQPRGHVLLIGVGGSGRQSITRLAAAIGEFDLVNIEISKSYDKNAWREDLKKIFRSAGVANKRVVFMFTDSQIKFSSMLEDINNILNTGEVPNLFPSDELQQVLDGVLSAAKEAKQASTPASIFKFFVSQCRKNLHMVLCFSPVGDGLRNRLRQFPSLVNCCTIDWFMAWPAEGLVAVAKQFLADVDIKPEIRGAVIQQCKAFQQSVREMTVKFQQQLRRINYVTPTSYLELIYTFKSLLGVKAGEVNMMRSRYDVGLQKLLGCADKVAIMQKELTDLQPVLVKKTAEVEEMLIVLAKDGAEAEEMEKKCLEEEAIATKSAGEAKELSDTCEAALAKALPALAAATDALKSLTKNDITEVKALKNPPKGVKVCMEAVCIMLEQTPDRVDSEDKKSKVDDYWKPAQKLLADSTFMQQLFNYDKDNIKKEVIKKVTPYIENPDFDPKVMEKVSKAANGLCKWVRAMHVYDEVAKIVEPKRIELKAAKESLKLMMDALAASKATLQAVQDKVAELKRKLQEAVDEKENLAFQVDKCGKQLARAEKLIGGLGGERVRWAEAVVNLTTRCENVCGDVLISSAVVAYLGIFTGSFRDDAISQWITDLKKMKIPCSDVVSLAAVLGDPVKIRTWNINGLPRDAVSIDNGIIMSYSRRWPLMIDPQGQANKWIRNTEKDKQMKFLKLTQSDFVRSLENAVEFGMPALLENVPETIDSILEPLLMKQVFKGLVTIGDKQCSYSPDFKLYITTKLPNPHYTPEISTKVVLVNFTITIGGLEDQLLGITVERERRELEEERQKLIVSNAGFKKQLKEIEDKILEMLSNASGDILEDEELINTLGASKQTSATIEVALKEAEATELIINDTRQKYRPVATRGSILFFCISDLRNVEPMYQYSLNWFISLFVMAIQNAEQSSDVNLRVKKLIEFFSYLLYKNVCRSLFEKDKLMYSFLNTIRIMAFEKLIDSQELRFLFTGFTATDSSTPPPKPADWIPERSWSELLQLCKLPAFGSVFADVQRDVQEWKLFYDSTNPQDMVMPSGFKDKFTSFQRLLIMRCFRPDKVVPCIQMLISESQGKKFVEPPPFDLAGSYADSTVTTPLIFVLSPGADPMNGLLAFAESKEMGKKIKSLSLGQGQGPIAEKMIIQGIDEGHWIVLQNCHLAPSWMAQLEKMCEELSAERAHPAFRLWLTAYPSNIFPVAVLQDGIKMTNEPPKGLKANLTGTYHQLAPSYFEDSKKQQILQRMHFGLAFFHASIQERRKYGALGWNIMYEFNESDLRICQMQLSLFIDLFDQVPIKALCYTAGETNYGGRVTDDYDRRTLMCMLRTVYRPEALDPNYKYTESGLYYCPRDCSIEGIKKYVASLPMLDSPETYGLHANADITSARNETYAMFETMLLLQPRESSGGGDAAEDPLLSVANDILARLPPNFNVLDAQEKYPTSYNESMNTVLTQELSRFNNLISVVRSSVKNVTLAIKGLVVMSSELEAVTVAMSNGQVPSMWASKSYPSLKPLGSYVNDLIARINFFNKWIEEGPPPKFWISGFFFTQSFLTGTLQNYARKYQIAIDTLKYSFQVVLEPPNESAPDGCYIYGLFLDGAAWDMTANKLGEALPKVLFSVMPTIWLKPCLDTENLQQPGEYLCPTYKTSIRKGTLSTTGHSTNYVLTMCLPTLKTEDDWIKRGVALLTQLDD